MLFNPHSKAVCQKATAIRKQIEMLENEHVACFSFIFGLHIVKMAEQAAESRDEWSEKTCLADPPVHLLPSTFYNLSLTLAIFHIPHPHL